MEVRNQGRYSRECVSESPGIHLGQEETREPQQESDPPDQDGRLQE